MINTKNRQQLALDMLMKRAENDITKSCILNDRLQFRYEDKPLASRAIHAVNAMFESRNSKPFFIDGNAVSWSSKWLEDNGFKKGILPGYKFTKKVTEGLKGIKLYEKVIMGNKLKRGQRRS